MTAAPIVPRLVGPLVTLRRVTAADQAPLLAALHEPEVAEWWVGYTAKRVREEFLERPDITRVIEVEGQTAGALYVMRGDDAEYPTTVMHLFIATRWRGRQIGAEALALAIRHEFASGISRVTLDPNVKNEGVIRSYHRLGFQTVGVLRDYQLRPNGELDDGLLLDITRRDFPEGPPLPERRVTPAR
ncbi:GNAT family N-acetyltransferase [Leucobacter sp. M11]|uniref:GNAT family N-acetyltransferase n=1 Tax=Leucobacter sp. M11 TaxID=2993565 RepID=UPI002D7EF809|nr:GNAT family protein [Leucobacter sp. M11]MEB4615619.1 GNAT family protein [Leucobacter sp. M11]